MIDALWSKSLLTDANHVDNIKNIYRDIQRQGEYIINMSLTKIAIQIGISRHISVMLDFINDPTHIDELDTYTKSKLK